MGSIGRYETVSFEDDWSRRFHRTGWNALAAGPASLACMGSVICGVDWIAEGIVAKRIRVFEEGQERSLCGRADDKRNWMFLICALCFQGQTKERVFVAVHRIPCKRKKNGGASRLDGVTFLVTFSTGLH